MVSASKPIPSVPRDTFQAARRVYNIHHIYLNIGDNLSSVLADIDCGLLDPTLSLNGDTVVRLALVTAFQYAEALPDPLASDATMQRMDWKYALYLPVRFPGIPELALCRFRQNLFSSAKGLQEFSRLLHKLGELGLFSATRASALEATGVLSKVCQFTRLDQVSLAMKAALGALGLASPDWLRDHTPPHWFHRYKTGRLGYAIDPKSLDLLEEAGKLGMDIQRLLAAVHQEGSPQLRERIEVRDLERVFAHQYSLDAGALHWREPECAACSSNHPGALSPF